jgi:hypothetical protein
MIFFALNATMFTLPGAMLLMHLTVQLADHGASSSVASVLLVVVGTLAGVTMLTLVFSNFSPLGALYGFVTAVAFIAALRVFKVLGTARS